MTGFDEAKIRSFYNIPAFMEIPAFARLADLASTMPLEAFQQIFQITSRAAANDNPYISAQQQEHAAAILDRFCGSNFFFSGALHLKRVPPVHKKQE